MRVPEGILSERGSRYAASGGPCRSAAAARDFPKEHKRRKEFARATPKSRALLTDDGPLKHDDGEAGAGPTILRMLGREGMRDRISAVTRRFGGTRLGGDRFRHVQTAVRAHLDTLAARAGRGDG